MDADGKSNTESLEEKTALRSDPELYTATMARLYAEQGHWNKAIDIYRYLLGQTPDRSDIAQALAEAEQRLAGNKKRKYDDLVPLFREWIDLMIRYDKVQKLKRIKSKY